MGIKLPIYLFSPTIKEGAESLPLIEFTFYDRVLDLEGYDALVFTSKNAVIAVNRINVKWREVPSIVIGEATANEVKSLGGRVDGVAKKSYSHGMADLLLKNYSRKKLLYLRPKKVLHKLAKELNLKGLLLDEAILYETKCVSYNISFQPEKNAILIFTSPSTIECYKKSFIIGKSNKVIAIGERTASAVLDDIEVLIAQEQTIDSALKLALSLSNTV